MNAVKIMIETTPLRGASSFLEASEEASGGAAWGVSWEAACVFFSSSANLQPLLKKFAPRLLTMMVNLINLEIIANTKTQVKSFGKICPNNILAMTVNA